MVYQPTRLKVDTRSRHSPCFYNLYIVLVKQRLSFSHLNLSRTKEQLNLGVCGRVKVQRCKGKSWIHNQNHHFISKMIEDFQEIHIELLEFVGQGDRTATEVSVCPPALFVLSKMPKTRVCGLKCE